MRTRLSHQLHRPSLSGIRHTPASPWLLFLSYSDLMVHPAIAYAIDYKKEKAIRGFPYGLLKTEETRRTDETEKDFPPLTGLQHEHWNQLGHRSFSIRSS